MKPVSDEEFALAVFRAMAKAMRITAAAAPHSTEDRVRFMYAVLDEVEETFPELAKATAAMIGRSR